MSLLTIAIAFILLTIIYTMLIFNSLVRLSRLAQEGWRGIDGQLKERADLIPNLLDTMKAYMAQESGLVESVTKLRTECIAASSASISERAEHHNQLTSALRQLFTACENYPALKTSANYIALQTTFTNIENQLQFARRFYNSTIKDLNILVESYPSTMVAKALHYSVKPYFEIGDLKDRSIH